jgi:transcription antitermination factor NusB
VSHRHRARRLALQGLCCLDVQGSAALEGVHAFLDDSHEPDDTIASARQKLLDTYCDREEIDRLLARHARHWELGRLAMVDRNILRLAVWELRSRSAPTKVAISEALRLAKEFSTAESPRFINGVLDAIAKEIHQEQGPPDDQTEETNGE